jgi:hypothetical protein
MHLDDGETDPILQKANRSGRARASAGRESLKGVVAFTVNRLCALGCSLPDAYEAAAKVLRSEGVSRERGKGTLTSRTVRGWYENVSADVGRHGEAAQTIDCLQIEHDARNEMNSKEQHLDRLAKLVREMRLGTKPT